MVVRRGSTVARRKTVFDMPRKQPTDTTKQALKLSPQGKRKAGRPVKTCRRSTQEEMKMANLSWNTAEVAQIESVGGALLTPFAPPGALRIGYLQQ